MVISHAGREREHPFSALLFSGGNGREHEDFLRIINELPPELAEIVFLRYSQELKLREIAGLTGTPLRTVQSRLRRALRLLRDALESTGGGKK